MSDYRVVNPATGEVESEFETATDAEIRERDWRAATRRTGHWVVRRSPSGPPSCTGSPTSTSSGSTSSRC